ncbi:uncharacterized protein JCM10292_007617 [Rhodotorula paludigena]|uniref:uncharacterized protein n=1 Tax=Rhodotorula paludigena TaxID=86838 RepID=UPI003176934B
MSALQRVLKGEADDAGSDSDASSSGPLEVSSTSPPSVPKLPPSPSSAPPPSASILLNPLHGHANQPQPGPSTSATKSRKRAPSFTVEVYSAPPPAHFFARDSDSASSSFSPPRINFDGFRSRSVSPAHGHRAGHPRSPSSPHSPGASSTLSTLPSPGAASTATIVSASSADSGGSGSGGSKSGSGDQSVKFAPLPPGRRAHRSNSLSIGVASRAKMISAQGGTPNMRGAKYAGPLQWYEGGEVPEDVWTWRDAQKGLSKLFKRRTSTASASSTGSGSTAVPSASPTPSGDGALPTPASPPLMAHAYEHARGRSASVSSATSSSDMHEARRMEREAKGKGREIEHIEEAAEDEHELEHEDVPATVADGDEADDEAAGEDRHGADEDEEDDTSVSEATQPRTPPDGAHVVDGDLAVERQRVLDKGKGVDDSEHRGMRVAS